MFQGWQGIEYPEYEVICPQTHKSFTVKTLNIMKEIRLKGSLITPIKITEHLNRVIWECIVQKPKDILTFDDFMTKLTMKDRDALLYGLYHTTYEEIRNYTVTCPSCKKDYAITINASSTFNYNPYPTDDILTKIVKIPLPVTKGVFAYINQPKLIDEIEIQQKLSYLDTELMTLILPIQKLTQESEGGEEIVIYTDKIDIADGYVTLTPRDKRSIFKSYVENFGNYGIELKCQSTCTHCGYTDIVIIDLVEQFFRDMYETE